MQNPEDYSSDIEEILEKRYDNGWDFWTTPDKRLSKGGPFSALESALLLHELGVPSSNPILQSVAKLVFDSLRQDGRFKLSPSGAIYPCHTIHAANVLCNLGYAADERLQQTIRHLFDIQYTDGGWRCNKFSYGRGPETESSNPFPTLIALNLFRFTPYANQESVLDKAVDFLLNHWVIRKPIGPCHYGMGRLFMQVEYPFSNYNLFVYVYVLSFYHRAQNDPRYLEALQSLESKMVEGKIVVERVNRKLAHLSFCKKGHPSVLATKRYLELKRNRTGA